MAVMVALRAAEHGRLSSSIIGHYKFIFRNIKQVGKFYFTHLLVFADFAEKR